MGKSYCTKLVRAFDSCFMTIFFHYFFQQMSKVKQTKKKENSWLWIMSTNFQVNNLTKIDVTDERVDQSASQSANLSAMSLIFHCNQKSIKTTWTFREISSDIMHIVLFFHLEYTVFLHRAKKENLCQTKSSWTEPNLITVGAN